MSLLRETQDLEVASESNLRSATHAHVGTLGTERLARVRASFEYRLAEEERDRPGSTTRADVLLAKGVR